MLYKEISKANLFIEEYACNLLVIEEQLLALAMLIQWVTCFLYPFPLFSIHLRKAYYISFFLCYKHRNRLGLSTFQKSYNNVSPFSSNCYSLSFLFVMVFLFYLLLLCFLINSSPTPTISGLISCFSFTLQDSLTATE